MKNKFIATLLSVVLLLTCFTVIPVAAEDAASVTYWDKTTSQPTADADGDGYLDISKPSELAWVINAGGSATGKYELLNDLWLNDMKVSITDGEPTVTKASDGSEITRLYRNRFRDEKSPFSGCRRRSQHQRNRH